MKDVTCVTSLATQKMQIKTTLRFHLAPIRMAVLSVTQTTTNAGEDGGETEGILSTAGGMQISATHCGYSMEIPQ
jgi:hypothetical protein